MFYEIVILQWYIYITFSQQTYNEYWYIFLKLNTIMDVMVKLYGFNML